MPAGRRTRPARLSSSTCVLSKQAPGQELLALERGECAFRARARNSARKRCVGQAARPARPSQVASSPTLARLLLKRPDMKILCATDFSEPALEASRVAARLARRFGDELLLVH